MSQLEKIAAGISDRASDSPAGTATAFDIALILAILEMVISNCDTSSNAEIAQRAKSPGVVGAFLVRRAAREQGVPRGQLRKYTRAVIQEIDEQAESDITEAVGELRSL